MELSKFAFAYGCLYGIFLNLPVRQPAVKIRKIRLDHMTSLHLFKKKQAGQLRRSQLKIFHTIAAAKAAMV